MLSFGVNTVVIDDDQILLALRSDLPVWALPGGAIEDGESLAQAAIRETREETGIDIVISRIIGVYSRPHWRDGSNHEIVFAARPVGGSLEPQDGESLEVRFFPVDELPDNLLWWHRERLLDAFAVRHAIMRVQDVRWPEAQIVYADGQQEISAEEYSADELVTYFCREPWREPPI